MPLHRVVERLAGVQAQYAPSAYIGLWSRVGGFERDALTRSLQRRSVIQATVMRGTIHLVSKRDFWPLAEVSRHSRQQGWLRVFGKGYDLERVRSLASELAGLLAGGPVKRKELVESLGIDSDLWNGVVNWVDLVRVPPSGTWESRRADLYGLATEWVGPNEVDEITGRDLLVRRYLTGFGPASRQDIRAFTLLPLELIDETLDRLRTRRLISDHGVELLDLRGAPMVDADVPAPPRFIGNWDALLLAHARGSGVLAEEHRTRIFHTKAPHSYATFLVDGSVRGTWREEGGTVVVDEFEPIPRRFRAELDAERERLETFLR